MRVALLNTKSTLRAQHIFECFAEGCRRHGDETVWVDDRKHYADQLAGADVGVQVCYPNRNRGHDPLGQFRVDVNEHMASRGKRIVTIDTGFLRNQSEYELEVAQQKGRHDTVLFDLDRVETYTGVLREIYYEVGYDGLKRNADYCTGKKAADASRLDELRRRFGIAPRPWRTAGGHVLLIGQTASGLSSQHVDIYRWYADAVRQLRKHTDREIVFRTHPRITKIRTNGSRIAKDVAALERAVGKPKNFRRSKNFLLRDDLKDCWAAIGFSSNASVTAAFLGVPVIAGDPANMAWDVAGQSIAQVEAPPLPDRTAWANRLAWSQFSCGEMADGVCWAHLRPHALKPARYAYEWRTSYGQGA